MNKKPGVLLLLLLAVVLLPAGMNAQKGLKFGFFALPQNTWLINNDDFAAAKDVYNHRITFGMAAGGVAGYNFTEHLGVRVNFMYSLQGQRWQNKNAERDLVTHTKRLHYMKVPLMIGFNTNTAHSKLIFSLYAGFQAGVLLKATYRNNDQDYIPDIALFEDVLDYPSDYRQHNWFNYGPVAEIGWDVKLTYNVMANLRIRGEYGLNDVENKNITYRRIEDGIPYNVKFYPEERPVTNNLLGGILFGITYTLTSQ